MRLALCLGAALSAALPLTVASAPAMAAVNTSDPSQFVDTLADEAFATLRSGDKAAARTKFRSLLAQYFAVDSIGDRLIRRWATTITPAQKVAYKAAFPNFIIGTYADRLFDYADADLKVVRTMPSPAGVEVVTQVTKPGATPVTTIWSLQNSGGYKVTNLKVGGVNLAISQQADFDSIIQRKGFDALVQMMKARS